MRKRFTPQAIGLALCMGALPFSGGVAHAQEMGTLYYYNVPESEIRDHYQEWRVFMEYNLNREPCQHYQEPPAGYAMRGCDLYRLAAETPVAEETRKLLPIVSSYSVYFDFDRSNIRPDQEATLGRISQEIEKYHPAQVTVSGYTDTSGSHEYNMILSQKRAQAVAKALTAEGVQNEVIDKEAYGEKILAVPTADGVRNQENRRVVVDFRR